MPTLRVPKGEDPESKLIATIMATSGVTTGAIRTRILLYLFEHRGRYVTLHEIIERVLNYVVSPANEELARDRISDLRDVLHKFTLATNTQLVCVLPDAIRRVGYKLEFRPRDAESITAAFWKPHVREREVFIVYVEQLIYQNWPRRYALRDPELNSESEKEALEEFKKKYPKKDYAVRQQEDLNKSVDELIIAHPEEITIAHPYVNYGDIMARDHISRWFDEVAFIRVENAISRRMDKARVWNSSAILFGDSRNNSMMLDVLNEHESLDITLEVIKAENRYVERARVSNPTDSELSRAAGLSRIDLPNGYALNYKPYTGNVLALVTRVKNRKTRKTVTIFCAEIGRAIEHLANLFTQDEWLQNCIDEVGWRGEMPAEFQILFLFRFGSLSSSYRMCEPEIVAWRPHIC